jgi:hypothetical protein
LLTPGNNWAAVLNSMLPGLGRDWAQIIASLSTVCFRTATHATEWEAVPARCAADDHTQRQGRGLHTKNTKNTNK